MSRAAEQRGSPSTDSLALVASLWFAVACNASFWRELMEGRHLAEPASWLFAGAVFVALVAVHFLLLGLVLHRAIAKPLLSVLLLATAFAVHYTQKFNVYLDPSMLRNVLRTDVKEASELFTLSMLPPLLFYAGVPLLLLWWVPLRKRPWPRALAQRIGWMLLAAVMAVGAVMAVFQKDPQVLITHPRADVKSIADMKGKPILIGDASTVTFWPWLKAKFGFSDSQIRKYTFNLAPFLVDNNAIQEGYLSSEPYSIEREGKFTPQVFPLADAGYPGYANMVLVQIGRAHV